NRNAKATTKPATAPPKRSKAAAKPATRARAKAAAAATAQKKSQRAPAARLPDFVPPCLAALHSNAPPGEEWLHEIKFDGYRIEARLDHGKVQLLTRKKLDWTHRFAPIAEAVKALPADTALIDGELVVEDDKGHSNFSLLQTDLKDGRNDRFVYWAFDLLYLDGKDIT